MIRRQYDIHALKSFKPSWPVVKRFKCRYARSHTLRGESQEERGSVNYEAPLVGFFLQPPLKNQRARSVCSRKPTPNARRAVAGCSPKGLVGGVVRPSGWCACCVNRISYFGRKTEETSLMYMMTLPSQTDSETLLCSPGEVHAASANEDVALEDRGLDALIETSL
jgi:hypothetical protein